MRTREPCWLWPAYCYCWPLHGQWRRKSATAEEVIQKTREAAEYLAKNKKAGIEAFNTNPQSS